MRVTATNEAGQSQRAFDYYVNSDNSKQFGIMSLSLKMENWGDGYEDYRAVLSPWAKYVIGEPERLWVDWAVLNIWFNWISMHKMEVMLIRVHFDDYWNSAYAEKMQVFWFVRSIGSVSIISTNSIKLERKKK